MTEMIAPGINRRKRGVRPLKKARLMIDMTPMVDLGFLLICFFVFTTEISKPLVTDLNIPTPKGAPTLVPDSKSLSFFLDGSSQPYFYFGDLDKAIWQKKVYRTSFLELNGMGEVIRQKQNELKSRQIDPHELTIIIKPDGNCSYSQLLTTLDEMLINGVTRYRLTEPEKNEENRLKSAF